MNHLALVDKNVQKCTKMSKLSLDFVVRFFNLQSLFGGKKMHGMKTVTKEKCNIHTLHHSIEDIIPKIINNL